jgi:thioredoxin reductase (NADPH)
MAASVPPSILEHRRDQVFPVLSPAQAEFARRFGGAPRQFKAAETVFAQGEVGAPAFLVVAGSLEIVGRDGMGHQRISNVYGPGSLSGEVNQLAGAPAAASGRAGPDGCEAVPFDAAQLRALIVRSAEVGEIVMRAFILRRMLLIQSGAGTIILGAADDANALRLQNFLVRNGVPHTVLDPISDAEAAQLVERLGIPGSGLPLAVCPDGTILRNPDERQLAKCLGLLPSFAEDRTYDVAIVGAGPAGLAAAVYATSEGLSVIVLDSRSFGGQAGASARIENYLGFPTGITGLALAGRAYNQAQKFGAVMAIPAEVMSLKCAGARDARRPTQGPAASEPPDLPSFELRLEDDQPVHATAIVVATGARYRRPNLANLGTFEGRGIHFWASPIEARLCGSQEVVLVGGGNSAGQATVFLASHTSKVHVLLRGRSLADNMSQYLIDRIESLQNVEVHTETELTQLIGAADNGLQAVRWRHRRTGEETEESIQHVFLFIGADPNAEWLKQCSISVDAKGFVKTGMELEPAARGHKTLDGTERRPLALETSQPGVFAIGDVRAGSVKRVSSAVGEGAAVVAQLHGYLADLKPSAPAGHVVVERPQAR